MLCRTWKMSVLCLSFNEKITCLRGGGNVSSSSSLSLHVDVSRESTAGTCFYCFLSPCKGQLLWNEKPGEGLFLPLLVWCC